IGWNRLWGPSPDLELLRGILSSVRKKDLFEVSNYKVEEELEEDKEEDEVEEEDKAEKEAKTEEEYRAKKKAIYIKIKDFAIKSSKN
ncbi:unnamed protein product, partial [Alternaria alternata]